MNAVPSEQHMFPAAIDYLAQHQPEKLVAILPEGNDLEDGFENLTYRAMAKAVDQAAWWLDQILGGQSKALTTGKEEDVEAVAYYGPDDYRYAVLLVACMKSRRKIFLALPTNTVEGQVKLLRAMKCKFALASSNRMHLWDGVAARMPDLKVVQVPELSHLMHEGPVEHYPYNRVKSKHNDDILLMIQTSGTTGDPKPIAITNRWVDFLLDMDGQQKPGEAVLNLVKDTYMPNLLPISWMAGIGQVLTWPVVYGAVSIIAPTSITQPVTAEDAYRMITQTPKGSRNAIMLTPAIIRYLAADEETLRTSLGMLDFVAFVGAPLDQDIGDRVARFTRVQSFMGATDSGIYPLTIDAPDDWNLHRLHPKQISGFHMQPFTDDLYEICIHRLPNESRHIFLQDPEWPNIQLAHTRDLFRPVSGREGYFTVAGRVDDFVKLSSQTKFNGIQIENNLLRNPDIHAAVVAGDGRSKPFVIIEPSQAARCKDEEALKRSVERSLEEANQPLVREAYLSGDLTLVTAPERPILRTAKGTVDRRRTIASYEKEVEELYRDAGQTLVNGHGQSKGEGNVGEKE